MNNILKRNNVRVSGTGSQTLLFAHGFGCDQNMWRYIVPSFEDRYKIILFDYVGCGKSELASYNEERYSSLDGYAEDILDICKALDLTEVIFIGHSVSCMIGVLASIRKPRLFSSMVFVCPSPRYMNDTNYNGGFDRQDLEDLMDVMDNNFIGWASFLAPVVMKNPDQPELSVELEKSFCSIDPKITRQFAKVTFFSDNRHDLKKVKVPTLILQCSDDAIAPDNIGNYVAEHVEGSMLSKMAATGHCPHMSHPQETIEKINQFLAA